MDKWIQVSNGVASVMPDKDCEIWIARCGFGEGWIQKVEYHTGQGYIDWDGTVAYQLVTPGETPKPYIMHFVNEDVFCEEIVQ